jgi:hypothetical protein
MNSWQISKKPAVSLSNFHHYTVALSINGHPVEIRTGLQAPNPDEDDDQSQPQDTHAKAIETSKALMSRLLIPETLDFNDSVVSVAEYTDAVGITLSPDRRVLSNCQGFVAPSTASCGWHCRRLAREDLSLFIMLPSNSSRMRLRDRGSGLPITYAA